MIREQRSVAFWNGLANAPETRPMLGGGTEPTDLSGFIENPSCLPLANDHGGFIFVPIDHWRYELHTVFAPEGRGKGVLPAFEEAARTLFTTTDAQEIVTKTAGTNRAASIMARRAGFRPLFVREGAWGVGSDLTYYALTLDEWMQRDPTLGAEGRAFHQMLEDAKRAEGSELPIHPDDAAHDRAAGAACLMVKGHRAAKAAWIYSRWAALAGYQTIELIEDDPPVLDVRDALVTVSGGRLEVIKCQQQQ